MTVGRIGELAARCEVRDDKCGRVVAVVTGHDDVAYIGRAMGDEFRPQRTDADPGASGELEVLRHPPVEQEATFGIAVVGETQRIAELVEPSSSNAASVSLGSRQ